MKKVVWLAIMIVLSISSLGTAAEPQITLRLESQAQVELVAPDGTRALIDVWTPVIVKSAPTAKDILAITHKEDFHYRAEFASTFPGQKLIAAAGEVRSGSVVVRTIATSHNAPGKPGAELGSNHIVVVEMAGLRIAHFGDIGQDLLTADQWKQLGPIDIAITQLWNPLSSMDASNNRAFTLMEQVRPRLIIPTYLDPDTATLAVEKWEGFYADSGEICLGKGDLGTASRFVIMGANAATCRAFLDLPAYPGAR